MATPLMDKAQAPKKLKLSKKMVQDALRAMRGNVSLAAQSLGVSRQTVYSYMQRYPELKDVRDDAIEYMLDMAEGHLEKDVLKGEPRAYEFYLKHRGKSRGYAVTSDVKMESALQLSPDVLELMKAHNIAIGDVARELELLLREAGHGDTPING